MKASCCPSPQKPNTLLETFNGTQEKDNREGRAHRIRQTVGNHTINHMFQLTLTQKKTQNESSFRVKHYGLDSGRVAFFYKKVTL